MKWRMDTGDARGQLALKICMCLLLGIVTVAIYWQVMGFDFINYDDPFYVINNDAIARGLNLHGIWWAFTTFYLGNWHPLTWVSLMFDIHLFGVNPGMHHLMNVVFHVLNTLLLFLILGRMTGSFWKSSVVAVLFALHPLHIESVAWITERKDVLSTFFWMLTIMGYLWYVDSRSAFRYALVVLLYILGLLSKAMLVTLPIILILLDIWPLKRLNLMHAGGKDGKHDDGHLNRLPSSFRLIGEKIPLVLLAMISCGVTFYAQNKGGAVQSLEDMGLVKRLANSIITYAAYLEKMVWPANLSIFYPYPESLHFLTVSLSIAFLLASSFLAVFSLRKFPYVFVGWFWYLITLVPVIGIVQVGQQSMADRYTYIPLVGIFIVIVWGLDDLASRLRLGKAILCTVWGIVLALLVHTTWVSLGSWKDSETVYRHALEGTENNYLAHNNLGLALFQKGDVHGAISQYQQSLRIKPRYVMARCNLGNALASERKFSEAIDQYRMCIAIDPKSGYVYKNLGSVLLIIGNSEEAMRYYIDALQIDPHQAEVYDYLGVAYFNKGNIGKAIECFQNAVLEKPGYADAIMHLEQARAARKTP
jgi:protein O-mannosyl-transferase